MKGAQIKQIREQSGAHITARRVPGGVYCQAEISGAVDQVGVAVDMVTSLTEHKDFFRINEEEEHVVDRRTEILNFEPEALACFVDKDGEMAKGKPIRKMRNSLQASISVRTHECACEIKVSG